jgi:hypothetical protein
MDIKTIIIKLDKPDVKYTLPVDWSGEPKLISIHGEDDDEETAITQSQRLYYQILTNHAMTSALEDLSLKAPYLDADAKRRFLVASYGYRDVESFDKILLNQYDSLTQTYATVVIHKGQYSGHVYVWISSDPSLCLMIGIRNRVDNAFIRGYPEYLPNVSRYLIEGCKQFARSKGCTRLAVIWPLEVMIPILERHNFVKSTISSDLLDHSVLRPERREYSNPIPKIAYISNL